MTARHDAETLRAFLASCRHRLILAAAIDGAAVGFALAVGVTLLGWLAGLATIATVGVATTCVLAACGVSIWRTVGDADLAPNAIERRLPACQNTVFTAAELLRAGARIRGDVADLVCSHATRLVEPLAPRTLIPLGRATARLGLATTVAVMAGLGLAGRYLSPLLTSGVFASDVVTIDRIEVTITPPAYTHQPPKDERDPTEVTAIAGSRLHVAVSTRASAVGLSTVETRQALVRSAAGEFACDLTADRDGFLLLEPTATNGRAGARKLIGLSITPDQPPSVRITQPGRDLFLTTAQLPLKVEIAGADDFGLAALRLTFTKVSGSGENFTFLDGEVPLSVTKDGNRRWTAVGTLAVASLGLVPGDTVVYRGLVQDGRPEAPVVESDAFIVQVITQERADLGGFALDDDMSRYAISQQMIIIKTERLIARRGALEASAYADAALDIAAEQRRLRAEFVFMIGGEMEDTTVAGDDIDETGEAAREEEIAAGRLKNPGYVDIMFATRHMSHAATVLTIADTTAGLKAERAALASLQRAFSKNRYLLRALATQQQLDSSRRLGGKLAGLVPESRPASAPTASPRTLALRRALSGIAALAGRAAYSDDDRAKALALSEALLRLDPAATSVRQIATAMADAAAGMSSGRASTAREMLDRAALGLAAVVREEVQEAPTAPGTDLNRLSGSLADAQRRAKEPR